MNRRRRKKFTKKQMIKLLNMYVFSEMWFSRSMQFQGMEVLGRAVSLCQAVRVEKCPQGLMFRKVCKGSSVRRRFAKYDKKMLVKEV